jgi:hypothetical protein
MLRAVWAPKWIEVLLRKRKREHVKEGSGQEGNGEEEWRGAE